MRLDKFLCTLDIGSRNQVKDLIKKGQVTVNGEVCKEADRKIHQEEDRIVCQGKELSYEPFVYYMLNKPVGVVSATQDNLNTTVLDLINDTGVKGLFPVGRLDKDTEGLLLITNDGELGHRLLTPKKHVPKCYLVKTTLPLTEEMKNRLEEGVEIGEKKPTLPAKAAIITEYSLKLTITEGKFHQVKRMLKAVGNEVSYLKRLSMGSLKLDEELAPGQFRRLTAKEIDRLKQN
ncbi:MAG: pseudouridine synthase [Lachnospiraceae bacterium]